jgi:hypothetical protein
MTSSALLMKPLTNLSNTKFYEIPYEELICKVNEPEHKSIGTGYF